MKNEWETLGDGRIVIWLQKPNVHGLDGSIRLYTVISEDSFDTVDEVSGTWGAIYGNKSSNWYTNSSTISSYRGAIHTLLMGTSRETKTYADHICIPDTLNNTLDNLRILDPSLSLLHQRKRRGTENNYRGVRRHWNKWRVDAGRIFLGLYETEQEARAVADAYYAEHAPVTIPVPPDAIYIPGSRSIFPIVPDHIYEKAGVLHLKNREPELCR